MKESDAYRKLKPALSERFHIDRVENAIMPGLPDVMLSALNSTMFVEMKAEVGKRLRGSQVSWCLRRHLAGCSEDMMVLVEDMGQFLIFYMVDVANNGGLVELELYHEVKRTPQEVAQFFYECIVDEELYREKRTPEEVAQFFHEPIVDKGENDA